MHKFLLSTFLFLISISGSFGQTADEYYQKALAKMEKGDLIGAVNYLDKAIELAPDSMEYLMDRGICYTYLEKYNEAYSNFNKANKLEPESPLPFMGFGELHGFYGESEKAVKMYSKALKKAEALNDTVEIVNALIGRSKSSYDLRNFDMVERDALRILDIDSMDIRALNNYALMLMQLNRLQEGVKIFERIVSIDTTFVYGYTNLGFILSKLERYEEAIIYYNKCLEYDSESWLAYNNRGYAKCMLGDNKGALKDVNKSIDIYAGNSYAYRNKAIIYFAMGKDEKACEQVKLALQYGYIKQYGEDIRPMMQKCGYR